jgi:hypothetical protein
MPAIKPSSSTCSNANSKKKKQQKTILYGCMDCQSPTPTSQNLPFFVHRSADYESWISSFQAIDELISSKNPNLQF